MKDFTQKFLCLILSLATVLSLSAPAFAADYSSAETLDGSLTSTLDYSNVKLSNSKELGVENINNELREIFPYGEIVSILEASNPVPTPLLGHRCRSSQEITGSPTPFSTSNHYLWICESASFSLSNPNIAA